MRLVYSTFPSLEDARRVAEDLLERRLIGCYNAFQIKSGYWWEGKINRDEEWACIFKTTDEKVKEVMKEVKKLHPYTTPAVFSIVVEDVDEDYENWLKEETRGDDA